MTGSGGHEVAAAYVSIYPKFADGFGTEIKAQTSAAVEGGVQASGKGAAQAGTTSGKKFGDNFKAQVQTRSKDAIDNGATGTVSASAGKASGKKFGEAFVSATQKAANALAIAGAVGSQVQAGIDKAEGSISSMSAATALAGQTMGGLDAEFGKVQNKLFIWQTGTSAATSFGDALRQVVGNTKGFDAFGTQLNGFIAGLVGTKTAAGELAGQVDKLDQSLAGMDPAKAQAAFAQVTIAAKQQGVGVDDLVKQFPEYKASLQNVVAALGIAEPSVQEYADWMGGKLPAAVQAAANAHPDLARELGLTTSATKDNTSATKANATVLDRYTHSLKAAVDKTNALYDARLRLRGDKRDFEAAINDATKSMWDSAGVTDKMIDKHGKLTAAGKKLVEEYKNSGKALDANTEKGRANQEALDRIIQSGRDWVQDLEDQKKPQSEINAAMKETREDFIRAATAMGMSGTAAARMATKLGLTKDAATKAKERLHDLDVQANKLAKKNIQFSVSAAMNKSADEIVYSTSGHGSLKFTAREFGGAVYGGTPGRDSVPSLLMPGEHVLMNQPHDGVGEPSPPPPP